MPSANSLYRLRYDTLLLGM